MIEEQDQETVSNDRSDEETVSDNGIEQNTRSEKETETSFGESEGMNGNTALPWPEYLKEESDKKNIYIQYRIYNNHGVMAGDDAQFENIYFKDSLQPGRKKGRESVFKDKDALPRWLADNYESYPMALMIAAAAFDSLPYAWIIQAAQRLFQTFEHHEETGCTYARAEILDQFDAEICRGEMNTYTGNVAIDIIHLRRSEYRDRILNFIWQQYPQLQDKIIHWLQSYNMQKPVSMSKRALETIGALACADYYYFLNVMVPQIKKNKDISTDLMIGQILIILNRKSDYKENVYNLLHIWSMDRQPHYLLTALFVCAQLQDKNDILRDAVEYYIQRALEELHENNDSKYQSCLYDFLGVSIRSYTFYRFLIEQLYDRLNEDISLGEKRDIYRLFLRLFSIDISLSRPDSGEDVILIKLCMMSHAVTRQIHFLWQSVWKSSHFKNLLYDLMALYDKKIYKTSSECQVEKFINKVLKNIYTKEMRSGICSKIHRRAGNE